MRLSSLFAIAGVFAAAAMICLLGARFAVSVIEDTSRTSILNTLDDNGLTWAEVDADGLQVYLAGTAPSEASRFSALSLAGTVVDAARVIDLMVVEEEGAIAAPRFSIEILRNESGLSLIGLIPASMDRAAFVERIEDIADGEPVADLLEAADYPAPETWDEVVDYGLRSLGGLDRTKISLDAERISVIAMTESLGAKSEVETRLSRRVPEGVDLFLDISAPRPVIAPFTLRFVIDEDGARFDACSADTEAARARILAAAARAGVTGSPECTIGLGVPSPQWSAAAEQAIAALARLGGGVVTFTDADISLLAPEGTAQGLFDTVVGTLDAELPDVFALTAVLPETAETDSGEAPEFTATLSPEGLVQLRGKLGTAPERKMVDSFAKARFSSDGVYMSARLDESLPDDWTYRVMTGLDALSYLSNGAVRITPDEITVSGATGQADAGSMISGHLSEKLGEGARFSINVRYREVLDPVASLPTPDECEEQIAAIQATRKITFEPGSANIDINGAEIMDDIAEILRECGEITMEIGGHTDSQGREVMNQQLSQARAQTVLNELRMRRVLTASITAVGYGETQPIADNSTEEGRDANRRIEFKVIRPEAVANDETTLESLAEEAEEAGGAEDQADADPDGQETTETPDEQN